MASEEGRRLRQANVEAVLSPLGLREVTLDLRSPVPEELLREVVAHLKCLDYIKGAHLYSIGRINYSPENLTPITFKIEPLFIRGASPVSRERDSVHITFALVFRDIWRYSCRDPRVYQDARISALGQTWS